VNYRIVVTARARADAVEAFRWIADRSPAGAARLRDGLDKAISKLKPIDPFQTSRRPAVSCTVAAWHPGREAPA
jgi:hypothetical protein